MKQSLLKLVRTEWLVVLAGAAVAVWLLLVKPIIGMADSGDFLRIMQTAGLAYMPGTPDADKYFHYFISQYMTTSVGIGGYISTQLIPVGLANLLDKLFTWDNIFDIRFLAVLYLLLLLWSVYRMVKVEKRPGTVHNVLLGIAILLILFDAAYLSFFNSLFGEPASYVFLLVTLAFALTLTRSVRPTVGALILFFLAAAFFAGAKVQNAPSGILAALLGIRFWGLRTDGRWKKTVVAGTAFLVLFSAAIYTLDPKEIRVINQYQSLFYGVLKDSPTPEKDLKELGVKPEFAVLKNTNYFTPGTPIKQSDPILQTEVFDKVHHTDIALFYLKHPSRFLQKMKLTANQAFFLQYGYIGNFEKSAGKEPGAVNKAYTAWSSFKAETLPHSLLFLVMFYLIYILGAIASHRDQKTAAGRRYVEIFLFIAVLGLLQFVVPVIGSGEADLAKHLFLFNVCFDLMALSVIIWLVRLFLRTPNSPKAAPQSEAKADEA
jgi:hypothetical protein